LSHFRDNDGNTRNEDGVVAGIVSAVNIPVRVTNIGEDAFSARIAVNFSSVFSFIRAVPFREGNEVRHITQKYSLLVNVCKLERCV